MWLYIFILLFLQVNILEEQDQEVPWKETFWQETGLGLRSIHGLLETMLVAFARESSSLLKLWVVTWMFTEGIGQDWDLAYPRHHGFLSVLINLTPLSLIQLIFHLHLHHHYVYLITFWIMLTSTSLENLEFFPYCTTLYFFNS